ncbi:hypothetical protein [Amycolatopsis sp. CB00013]|uniref:hypothetical protein n=1 Tax=Amycolatopsis sp. CB00013 TaxID=1703945 RepID=UPI00116137F5|nr:hypothetical protein [Amycolatopsis sp. CB00013]
MDIWLGNLKNTYDELVLWMVEEQRKLGEDIVCDPEILSDASHLRLLDSSRYGDQPSVRWLEIDLAGRDRKESGELTCPAKERDPEFSAGLEVLAACAVHPNYLRLLKARMVSGLIIGGLEVHIPRLGIWTEVPVLRTHCKHFVATTQDPVELDTRYKDFGHREIMPVRVDAFDRVHS